MLEKMLKKDLIKRVKVLESVLKLYKNAEKLDTQSIKELEIENQKLHKAKEDARVMRSAMYQIFNDALNSVNISTYTPKGLMNLVSKELVKAQGKLTESDLREMYK